MLQGAAEVHFGCERRSRLSVAFRGGSDSISASASGAQRRGAASSQLCGCSPELFIHAAGMRHPVTPLIEPRLGFIQPPTRVLDLSQALIRHSEPQPVDCDEMTSRYA